MHVTVNDVIVSRPLLIHDKVFVGIGLEFYVYPAVSYKAWENTG